MRVELGAPVVLVDGVDTLWHLPGDQPAEHWQPRPTLCGLAGGMYAYRSVVRGRRGCGVCVRRARGRDHVNPALGPLPEKRGGRPRGTVRRLTDLQVRALHRAYVEQRLSCYELARRIDWRQLGYASEKSAANSIWRAFHELGLETRTQSESTTLRNRRHGRATRARRAAGGDHGPNGYRAWLKREHGRYQPRCAGTKTTYPGKGRPCTRPAQVGSDFCFAHDPARKHERELVISNARARSPVRTA
jgi:hypothetical protein